MRDTDAYERWLEGAREHDYSAYFEELLEDLLPWTPCEPR